MGVSVKEYVPIIKRPYTITEDVSYNYRVYGSELRNGTIKIEKDLTNTHKEGDVISRDAFDVAYFAEAL